MSTTQQALEALERFDLMSPSFEDGLEEFQEDISCIRSALTSQAAEMTAPSSRAASDVLAERQRQIEVERWAPEHDDLYAGRELVKAAISYAMSAAQANYSPNADAPSWWTWSIQWWKPTAPRRDLVKAAALIIAEIERLDRSAAREDQEADNFGAMTATDRSRGGRISG